MNKCQKFNLFSTRKSLKNSRRFSSNDHINGHLHDRLEKELYDEEDCNFPIRKTSIDKFVKILQILKILILISIFVTAISGVSSKQSN